MTDSKYNKLIVQVSLQDFTFCIKNQISNEIIHFKSFPINSLASLENQLENIFDQNELLQVFYNDVLVLHDNNLNTLVPEDYFDEQVLGSYLQYNTKVFATDFFSYDDIENHKIKNVYVPYVAYNNFFIDKFGEFVYKNSNTNLIEYVLEATKNIKQTKVYCHIGKNHFEVIVSNNGELQLFNSFEYQAPEDFIYYILFVYEQLKLNPEIDEINLLGSIKKEDANYKMVYNYIRNVVLRETDISIASNIENEKLENHYILIHS